jgi:prevent-host-death family protein
MFVSVSDAKAQLTELVRRAEAGDEVILTRHGTAAVRLVSMKSSVERSERRSVIERAQKLAQKTLAEPENAARSQDFLYPDEGMP